jgi:hypothetical protein
VQSFTDEPISICPECGKEVTIHGLKYSHKRYCKANQQVPPGLEQSAPMPQLVRTVTTDPISSGVPTDEHIASFILNQRKMKANLL